jgi:hypothetical protein
VTLSGRDKKLVVIWAMVMTAGGIYYFSNREDAAPKISTAVASVPLAERKLGRMRQLASMVPGKTKLADRANLELAGREKGILQADTAAQAQALLLQLLLKLTKGESIDVRTKELGQARQFGDAYGEVLVSIGFETTMDALVNLSTKMTQQPELIATDEVRVSPANPKQKTVQVRLTVSAVVPRKLVPEKKGLAVF